MDAFSIGPHHYFLLGLLIVILTLLRLTSQRFRKNAEKKRQYAEAVQAAKEAERKRQLESVVPKSKVSMPKSRLPLADPFGTPFTGNIQGIAAKWEAEVHQIGRQIIGQIDSKMAALQAITLDANRTANRLEILVEHLEQIARQQIEWQRDQMVQNTLIESTESVPVEAVPINVIPAAESVPDAAPLTNMLKELTEDLEGIHKAIKQSTTFDEQPKSATILRLAELQAKTPVIDSPSNLRGEVEMLSNYGLNPQEIAQRLNISLGEVDLMLQVQQNRLDRTT